MISMFVIVTVALFAYFYNIKTPELKSEPEIKQLKFAWSVRNKTNRTVRDAILKIYSPVGKSSYQVCEGVSASHAFETVLDKDGNSVLVFRIPEITPYSVEIINIKTKVIVRDYPEAEAVVLDKKYLSAGKFIESDNTQLMEKAKELKGENVRETAGNISRWITDNLRYAGYLQKERGALYAYRNRTGDCTEYMDLFVAMCRGLDIPARCIAGYIVKEDKVLKPAGLHNWAEFYDGRAWQIADPQNGKFMVNQSDYIAMRIYGGYEDGLDVFERFSVSDRNLNVKMN